MPYGRIDGRNTLEYMLIQHILRISFVGYNNKKNLSCIERCAS